jgi:hypothetical protein
MCIFLLLEIFIDFFFFLKKGNLNIVIFVAFLTLIVSVAEI